VSTVFVSSAVRDHDDVTEVVNVVDDDISAVRDRFANGLYLV